MSRPKLLLQPLDRRDVPAFLTGAEIVVGADAGSPGLVRLLDASTQTEQAQFLPYGPNFFGGVRLAVGDVTGDGYPDLITAAGPSGGPQVNVYDGQTGDLVSSFMAFSPTFSGGVNVAVADLFGTGRDEIICGAGAGGGPEVAVFDGTSGVQLGAFLAYDPNFLGGVRVAGGDLFGTGRSEIITAPGYGGPDVRFYQFDGTTEASLVGEYAGFDPAFTGGVYVAAGDLTGGGRADVIVGAGPGGGPRAAAFTADGTPVASFDAYDAGFLGGVRVAAADLTGPGPETLLTVAGPGGGAQVNAYTLPGTTPVSSLDGFPASQNTGAFVAGSPQPLNVPSSPTADIAAAYNTLQQLEQNNQAVYGFPVGYNTNYGLGYPFGLGGFGGYGFGGYGYGGLGGAGYYDAPGLYSSVGSLYGPSFFGNGYYGSPTFVPATAVTAPTTGAAEDPGYYNPDGYPIGSAADDGFGDGIAGGGTALAANTFGGGFGGFGDFGGGDFGGGDGGGDGDG